MALQPFSDIPRDPWGHFQLHFYLAILRLLDQLAYGEGSAEAVLQRFPFLRGYFQELAERGVRAGALGEGVAEWREALATWTRHCPAHLPLRAWQQATGVATGALDWFFLVGLVEEDVRFGHLYASLQETPGLAWPTTGLLSTWQPAGAWNLDVRAQIRQLQQTALLISGDPQEPRPAQTLRVNGLLWDLVRGQTPGGMGPGLSYERLEHLPRPEALILPPEVVESLARVPALVREGDVQLLLVRGPAHNGRHTVLKALACSLERGALIVDAAEVDKGNAMLGNLAIMLPALPIVRAELGPGETLSLPNWQPYRGPAAVALGAQGGVRDAGERRAFTIRLPLPEPALRRRHWERVAGLPLVDVADVANRFRLTSGNIYRAGTLAATRARLDGATAIDLAHVRQATRTLNRQALDSLASYLPATGDWSHLAVSAITRKRLQELEARCRQRERLPAAANPALAAQLNAGVRALFSGPSGTGKTLAARLLASALGQDLYRLNLSAVVNKYIGETEKNLEQALARAEELDVILLLDEGDALLTRRTNVSTANDRYANLETNYLLQRLESFSGILLVTTNAVARIDGAFQRRMDVVIEFQTPDALERWQIWELHLPLVREISQALLQEVAARCELTGGQIRNAALHATLLALEEDIAVTEKHLVAAVHQEYDKQGTACPLNGTGY